MPDQIYNARFIARITGGKLLSGSDPDAAVRHIIIDSRKPVSLQADVFFAIVTQRNDGHRYISELLEKGVANFVVSQEPNAGWLRTRANFIRVDDTLQALQNLAAWHRKLFDFQVLGITGSNGKTIVKEWLCQLIGNDLQIVRSPKSYNSQIGVPLSVWQMQQGHELGIFEAGISLPGEMEKLEKIIRPSVGLFTNLGPAHDENFASARHKATEKLQLFRHCRELICCSDHKEIIAAFHALDWETKPRLITWSRKPPADLEVLSCEKNPVRTIIKARYRDEQLEIKAPFTDEASVENIIHCWLSMLHLGFTNQIIAERVQHLHPVAMRLTLKEGINNCSLIDDSYSSDLASLGITLDFLQQQNQHRKKTLILSDLLQSGRIESELYSEIANLIKRKNISRFIGVGPAMLRQKHVFSGESMFFGSTKEMLKQLPAISFRDESILIKGARVFGFEQVIQALQQKTHETVLEVNMDALVHNLNFFRSKLNPGVKLMAMVKAFSYGSGSYEIANVLQFHRADYLAVAYADEGVELRKAGIRLPIMVMNPEEQGYEGIFKYGLEPEIYNLRTLELLKNSLKRFGKQEAGEVNIHIKLDTGMHRLGFDEANLHELLQKLSKSGLRVASVFSHLAASDDERHDAFTNRQIETFERMCRQLEQGLGYKFYKHILNTAGITRFAQAQYDMVRLGIGLYGISNLPEEQPFLQHVSTLKSIISQIKRIPEGATIGYNREFKTVRDTQIAIVPVGYADGLSRSLSNGRYSLLVNGEPAPIAGNISMDMCMIDITGIQANEGDEVIIFSPELPITELAKAMHTIPYEVLTGISRRVKRVYYQE